MIRDYQDIEKKWKQYWQDNNIHKVDLDTSKPKYYVLDMFPYPSGAGLHVGHPLGYIASDIFSRHKRMSGYNVLHPMGFDAFGLPAEEYALQTGIHPAVSTAENMSRYREQLSNLGFSYDWSRELYTCDPKYYKWTQWIFTQLFEHYYDIAADQAKPISELISQLETSGNHGIQAAHSCEETFSADEWNAYSKVQQENILMCYRLAYRKVGYVNWCEALGTVLANDQVKDGISERGGHPVVQKAMTQWYLRITAYADRLLSGLENIDWSHSLKTIQRNWIGRSEGCSVFFDIKDSEEQIEIFTTRADTIFGATYMVLAPEHDYVKQITTAAQQQEIDDYVAYVKAKSEVERMAEKSVTGAFTGAYAINPLNGKEVPIWIGEYVLKDYGTGAIMAVPSDDDRDKAFAEKFGLEIIDVVDKSKYPGATLKDKIGVIINSDFLNGMEVKDAIQAAHQKIEEIGRGKAVANYKLRDANFSRQRYWGEPFPILYDSDDIAASVALDKLPVELPDTSDFKPGKGGQSPLARITDWAKPTADISRETDTMPAVAGSSWYFLRYMDPHNDEAFASQESINYWESVDLYIGGSEHAVAHLMYARFWHKFLYDKGLVPTDEPFKKLINQGMIQGVIEHILVKKDEDKTEFYCAGLVSPEDMDEYTKLYVHIDFVSDYEAASTTYLDLDGLKKYFSWRNFESADVYHSTGVLKLIKDGDQVIVENAPDVLKLCMVSEIGKMSKSRYNVINPDEVTARYGTDCFRMYEMFLGPIEQSKPWDIQGIDGVSKFLKKFIGLYYTDEQLAISEEKPTAEEHKVFHTCIKKVNADIANFSFNTAVSSMMVCVNELRKSKCNKREILGQFTRLIAPFAPFLSEELWSLLGHTSSVHLSTYPTHDEQYLVEDTISYPICINGKKRGLESFSADASREDIMEQVKGLEYVDKWLEGKPIKKVIVVPNRMVNIVV